MIKPLAIKQLISTYVRMNSREGQGFVSKRYNIVGRQLFIQRRNHCDFISLRQSIVILTT